MGNRLQAVRWAARSPERTWLLARMAPWAVSLPLLKFVVPLPKLVGMATPRRRGGQRRPEREAVIVELTRLLARTRAMVAADDNCLERSLLTYRFLAREGADPRLVVGMAKADDSFEGHVWVLVDGEPVHDEPELLERYSELMSFNP
jgi:Transglutaminase-like superfamily